MRLNSSKVYDPAMMTFYFKTPSGVVQSSRGSPS